jgi:hypothetical protein
MPAEYRTGYKGAMDLPVRKAFFQDKRQNAIETTVFLLVSPASCPEAATMGPPEKQAD